MEIKELKNSKAFNDYSQTLNVYKNLEDYNRTKKLKVLKVFDTITDREANQKLSPILTELFLRARKLNILLVFISQSYFKVPKTIRLNAIQYFIKKTLNKTTYK